MSFTPRRHTVREAGSVTLQCEAQLHRVEVFVTPDPEKRMEWSITRMPGMDLTTEELPEGEPERYLTGSMGHLSVCDTSGFWGQALVVGLVVGVADDLTDEVRQAVECQRTACDEMMYDVARRALQMNAAQMDRTFSLPTKAPDPALQDVLPVQGAAG